MTKHILELLFMSHVKDVAIVLYPSAINIPISVDNYFMDVATARGDIILYELQRCVNQKW